MARTLPANLSGEHPRKRHKRNLVRIVTYCRKWGITTVRLLHGHLGVTTTPRLVRAAERMGLLRHVPRANIAEGGVRMLTRRGLQLAEAHADEDPGYYPLSASALATADLPHQLAMQIVAQAVVGNDDAVIPDRYWDRQGENGKVPDFVQVVSPTAVHAHEIELNRKRGQPLGHALARYLSALQQGTYQRVVYHSPYRWLLSSYERVLNDPRGLTRWMKDSKGVYQPVERRTVPAELRAAFEWHHTPNLIEEI